MRTIRKKTIDDDDADKMPGHKSFACFPRGRAGKSFQKKRKSYKNSEVPRGLYFQKVTNDSLTNNHCR